MIITSCLLLFADSVAPIEHWVQCITNDDISGLCLLLWCEATLGCAAAAVAWRAEVGGAVGAAVAPDADACRRPRACNGRCVGCQGVLVLD